MSKIKVENMISSRGNTVANQFIIYGEDGSRCFQSYKSIIAKIHPNGKIELGQDWNYSTTTSKYRNLFLRETTAETKAKLKSGEYTLNEAL